MTKRTRDDVIMPIRKNPEHVGPDGRGSATGANVCQPDPRTFAQGMERALRIVESRRVGPVPEFGSVRELLADAIRDEIEAIRA